MMKYKCKENDAIIELGKNKDELLIYIDGETTKTVIGVKDLIKSLKVLKIDTDSDLFNDFWFKSSDLLAKKDIHTEYREGVVDCRILFRQLKQFDQ